VRGILRKLKKINVKFVDDSCKECEEGCKYLVKYNMQSLESLSSVFMHEPVKYMIYTYTIELNNI